MTHCFLLLDLSCSVGILAFSLDEYIIAHAAYQESKLRFGGSVKRRCAAQVRPTVFFSFTLCSGGKHIITYGKRLPMIAHLDTLLPDIQFFGGGHFPL